MNNNIKNSKTELKPVANVEEFRERWKKSVEEYKKRMQELKEKSDEN